MTKLFWFLIGCFICSSCSNELDLLAPKKDIPIVYGILSISDSIQIIRIEKAFLSEEPPSRVAQDPNSIYYNNLDVTINGVTLEINDDPNQFPSRDSGFFASEPNQFFYVNSIQLELLENQAYTLEVIQEDKVIASAETILVPQLSVSAPRRDDLLVFDRPLVTFRWSKEDLHYLYDINIHVQIQETLADGSKREEMLIWNLVKDYTGNRYEFQGDQFYKFLGGQLEQIDGIRRKVINLDLEFIAGGEALQTFRTITKLNNGIIGIQSLPNYTNIEGGLGVLSSRARKVIEGILLSQSSLDLLREHESTIDLGF